jgi:hypothetical protein
VVNESGGSLTFNSKQLEELENIHDSTGAFEEDSEDKDEDVGDGAMEWRRNLLEEAAEAVKRAKTRPVDAEMTYEIGSLLFDRESGRFGRVNRSVPGYLRILYLTGGDREYGLLDVEKFLGEFAANKKLSELALQLGMSESDVDGHLDNLGLSALEEEDAEETPDAKADGAADKAPKAAKAKGEKKAAGKKKAAKKEAKAAKPKRAKKAPPPIKKGGKKANPIDDPNTFIQQNFQEMSNRELARHTGLSEHTIRRKLGEWGLKRAKKPKK